MRKVIQPANKVVLNGYVSNLYCPFCGEPLPPDMDLSCKHLLYLIAGGNFISRTEVFDALLGDTEGWPELDESDRLRLGNPYEVANEIREKFIHSIEFELYGMTDSTLVGFGVK